MSKSIHMWFDGDVKRHYFSNKVKLNSYIKEFINELKQDSLFGTAALYPHLKNKSNKEIINYFSSTMFVERIELDI